VHHWLWPVPEQPPGSIQLSFGAGDLLLSLDLSLGQNLSLCFDLLLGNLFGFDRLLIFRCEPDVGKVDIVDDDMVPSQIIPEFPIALFRISSLFGRISVMDSWEPPL